MPRVSDDVLRHYLECGGNYDESAAVLHVHRSTLRYRLGRIADLTGFDLRNVDTRFNLHAATRVWRFLSARLRGCGHPPAHEGKAMFDKARSDDKELVRVDADHYGFARTEPREAPIPDAAPRVTQ